MRPRLGTVAVLVAFAALAPAQSKKPLDHSVYDGWKTVAGATYSRDGKYLAYAINPQEGDGTLFVRRLADGATLEVPRGTAFRFTQDSGFLLATQPPKFLEARDARRAKKKAEDQPKSALAIVDLKGWKTEMVERVATWSLATDDRGWILIKPEPAPKKPDAAKAEEKKPDEKKDDKAPKKKSDHKPGDAYLLRKLGTDKQERLDDVARAVWSRDGSTLLLALSTPDGAGDGVSRVEVETGKRATLVEGMGRYPKIAVTDDGRVVAVVTDRDDYAAKKPTHSLYLWGGGERLLKIEPPKNDDALLIAEGGELRFSRNGKRLLYATAPKPVEDKETPDDEKVSLDVWNWKDPYLQPQQLLQQKADRERTYLAVWRLDEGGQAQLETPRRQNVTVGDEGNANVALATDNDPYAQLVSWDGDYEDVSLVDVRTGKARLLVEKLRGQAQLSPDAKTVAVLDEANRTLTTYDTKTGSPTRHNLPNPLFDELDDHPDFPSAYGVAGWTKGGDLLVYDRFDLWRVDPTGKNPPQDLTGGRASKTRFRALDLDPEDRFVNPDDLWLSVRSELNQYQGVYRRQGGRLVAVLPLQPKSFPQMIKARNAEAYAYRRGDVVEFPDLWTMSADGSGAAKVTDANPQQRDYNWLTAERVTWTGADGQPLEGILYKPEDFDAGKKYPMIAYFYERNVETLYDHKTPSPSASTINIPLFVSQGYLVFVPDITYKVGYPGESAASAIVSGVNSVVARGYVDPKRLGIQGQSWGGYQVAYLVTETDMFAAAGAGAPVSNMFSAYGGIRYGSGLVRQFQYERQQSRIGGTPWDSTLQYIENSPIFHLPKVRTPLLIMHNDKDGAVPYTQGIELFTGLRRLGKPAWLLVYNEEDHNLVQRKNRKDLSIRLSQFFDHFLKGAPEPVWMSKGVPAVDKGRTMGTEIPKG